MKRTAISMTDLASRDNLLSATWKAAKGKRHRPAVARFVGNLDASLDRLADDILNERAPVGRYRQFTIRDPKQRVITAACFADRVLHHAILNLAEPRFERMLVGTTYACRPDKGVHAAAIEVQRNLRRFPWVVQVDVAGYFPSIDHDVLKALLARRFKGVSFLALLGRIIDAGATDTPGRGLPIGALTSQHFANAYLDGADRFLLARPDVQAHVRYMDDIVWWCPTHSAALASLDGLQRFLRDERRLRLKPGVRVGRSSEGLSYCGFRIRAGVVLASSRKLSRYRSGMATVQAALKRGAVSEGEAQRTLDTLLAMLVGARTTTFRQRMHNAVRDKVEADD